jgi:hypothetical protein
MKMYTCLICVLVLTAALLVGCGCTNQKMDNTSAPTVLPTNEEIWNSTEPSTRPTTQPTTQSTEPSQTIDRGNGPLEDSTTGTTGTTEGSQESRTRSGFGAGSSGMGIGTN